MVVEFLDKWSHLVIICLTPSKPIRQQVSTDIQLYAKILATPCRTILRRNASVTAREVVGSDAGATGSDCCVNW